MERCCLFSGLKPDNHEHVIPDWLQRRFALQKAKYRLPNASGLDYRHAKVPANKAYNEMFGRIETRISQNKFVWEEIYLWLFKIHIGLMYRDTSLRCDVREPEATMIGSSVIIAPQIEIFRHLVKSYFDYGTFQGPSPPGSVFVLPSLSGEYFDFQHSFTCGCIGVNVGNFYLAASLWDFGIAKEFGYFDWVWDKKNYGKPPSDYTVEEQARWYHHVHAIWLCSLGYWSFRWNINMYKITEKFQPKWPEFQGMPYQRPEDPAELSLICKTFGLELEEYIPDGKSLFRSLRSTTRVENQRKRPDRMK